MAGISVDGTGEVTARPDTASIDLGVSLLADTVGAATSKAAEAANSLIASLKANGLDAESITTTNYSVNPEYDYRSEKERFVGYRVNNTVRAKIVDLANLGSVIDDATNGVGDAARVNGISFTIENDSEMVKAARDAAWNDAFSKATQLAQLSGQTLGPVVSISESLDHPPMPVRFARVQASDESTGIEPGTSSVSVSLRVEFSISS